MAAPPSTLASAQIPLPQFMIALALLKSKPAAISTEEYLARLRSFVRIERHSNYKLFPYKHLGSAEYRANAQTEARHTILSLQARVAELESKSQGLSTFMDLATESDNRITTLPAGKRKRKTSDPGNRPRSLARQARIANSSSPLQTRPNDLQKPSAMAEGIALEAFTSSLRVPKDAFLYHVYLLQQETQNPNPEPTSIAACLERCFEVARQIACSAELQEPPSSALSIHPSTYNHHRYGATASLSIHQNITKFLPMLHKAMDHLEGSTDVHNVGGILIYKVVRFYEEILSRVCKLWDSNASVQTVMTTDREEGQSIRAQVQDPGAVAQKQRRIMVDLCELAIAMTSTLNPGKRVQLCMLEGCLSVLLNKIGSGLKACVFDQAIIDAKDSSSSGIQQPAQEDVGGDYREQKNPYLVYILQNAPNLQDENTIQCPESTLLTMAKKKWQHTLLNSVFGENALGLLRPSLDAPTPPPELQHVGGVKELKARDWYTSEVWQLVGWDVLDDYLRQPLKTPTTFVYS